MPLVCVKPKRHRLYHITNSLCPCVKNKSNTEASLLIPPITISIAIVGFFVLLVCGIHYVLHPPGGKGDYIQGIGCTQCSWAQPHEEWVNGCLDSKVCPKCGSVGMQHCVVRVVYDWFGDCHWEKKDGTATSTTTPR